MTGSSAGIAFDFIDRLRGLTCPEEVVATFSEALRGFGFHSFLITGLPLPGRKIEPYVLLNGWRPDWFDHYAEHNYIHCDPIATHCYSTIDPFLWSEVTGATRLRIREQRVMDEATEFEMNEGLVVPIFDSAGFQAAVTMAGGRLDLCRDARPAVHLMAIYAHSTVRDLIRASLAEVRRGDGPGARVGLLTARESEILKWTAVGKTAWEISCILNISRRTVEGHLFQARCKLDTATSTQAVVEALKLGLIRL